MNDKPCPKYLMTLDSVRDNSEDNDLIGEYNILKNALEGYPTVLSPNQAMDSLVLQDIVIGNDKNGRNPFCEAVQRGIVRVAIPKEYRDLIDYCIASLTRSRKGDEFVISGLKFLNVKDSENNFVHPLQERKELAEYICKKLSCYRKKSQTVNYPQWLEQNQKDEVDYYINSVILLDRSIEFYEDYRSNKKIFPVILETMLKKRLSEVEFVDVQRTKLIKILLREIKRRKEPSIYRSHYYRVIGKVSKDFDKAVCDEIKTIVDIAYNRILASALSATVELGVSDEHAVIVKSVMKNNKPQASKTYSKKVKNTKQSSYCAVNWEQIVYIYDEVKELVKKENLEWLQALRVFYSRERTAPFKKAVGFVASKSIKVGLSLIAPSTGVAGNIAAFCSDPVGDGISNVFGSLIDAPSSIKDLGNQILRARGTVKTLDTFITIESKAKKQGQEQND